MIFPHSIQDPKLRELYDADFVGSGCDPDLILTDDFIEATNIDNTPATYITNYIIGLTGVVGAYYLCRKYGGEEQQDNDGNNNKNNANRATAKWALSAYVILSGIGYAIAGMGHHLIGDLLRDPVDAYFVTAYVFTAIGLLPFVIFMTIQSERRTMIRNGFTIITGLAIAGIIWEREGAVAGIYLPAMYSIFGIYFAIVCHDCWSVSACILIVIGFVIAIVFRPWCGLPEGYELCFEECPFDVFTFNQNALFHILLNIGIIMQIVASYDYQLEQREEEDGKGEK